MERICCSFYERDIASANIGWCHIIYEQPADGTDYLFANEDE